ncbi:MAG TPA: hypothetical protein VI997_09570 [Candidatus Thermoplasmatota archaeon]|nr:hypothetical protein [Candidatus Thermoplasmatota archaeon]
MGPVGTLWDWLVLDCSYFLVLLGGSMTLRARSAGAMAWILFGFLSVAVGALLLIGTSVTQDALQHAASAGAGRFATAGP